MALPVPIHLLHSSLINPFIASLMRFLMLQITKQKGAKNFLQRQIIMVPMQSQITLRLRPNITNSFHQSRLNQPRKSPKGKSYTYLSIFKVSIDMSSNTAVIPLQREIKNRYKSKLIIPWIWTSPYNNRNQPSSKIRMYSDHSRQANSIAHIFHSRILCY